MPDRTEIVDASPTKQFFVDIVTRDISIEAILDLVDNSVDSARNVHTDGDFSSVKVNIVANSTEFSIEDTCGGIGVEKAKNYVFRMGRPEEVAYSPGSIGQFGVGMKRALFKLGSSFIVNSVTKEDDFSIEIDVTRWFAAHEWSFPMTVHDREPSARSGTTIIVDELHQQVKDSFTDERFQQDLADELRSRHRLAIGNGLQIRLNGDKIQPADSTIAVSDLVKPALRSFTVQTPGGGELSVSIVAGVAPKSLAGIDEDAEPEAQARAAKDAGWLVFGNGRLLLANDKSRLTGWGSGKGKVPQYHNQFARFRGFVYMQSDDANAVPWNTMKTSVDSDSPVWVEVRTQMIGAARSVIDLLNFAKVERQLATPDTATPVLDALSSAVPLDAMSVISAEFSMSMDDLRGDFSVDAAYPEPNPDLVGAWKKIQYSVDSQVFDEVAVATGKQNAAEIGRMSFESFYDEIVGG
jgi:hypothetical protein